MRDLDRAQIKQTYFINYRNIFDVVTVASSKSRSCQYLQISLIFAFILNCKPPYFMGSENSKKESSFDDILLPLKQSGIVDQQIYQSGKFIIKHLQNKQRQQIHDHFQNRQIKNQTNMTNPNSVCLYNTKKDEIAYECMTCQYVQAKYFCADCFQPEMHAMHDYRAVQNKKITCECGNDQVLDENFFCKKHSKVIIFLSPEDSYLKKEVKFYVELLLFLKQNPNNPTALKIAPDSFQYFYGQPLLQYLVQLTKTTRRQVVVAETLLDRMDILNTSEKKQTISHDSLLQDLIFSFCQSPVLVELLVQLINQLFWSSKISKQILRIYYRVLLIGDTVQSLPNIFQKIKYDFILCFKNQTEYFSDLTNCRFFINRGIQSADHVFSEYSLFYGTISRILRFHNCTKIITNIMRETRYSKFFNYQFEGPQYKQIVNKLTIPSFILARKIIKTIQDKETLKIIALSALDAIIKKKKISFDLIFERSFAIALFQYFDWRIPEASELQAFLSEIKLDPQELILQFWESKETFFEAYVEKVIKNQKGETCPSQTILAVDHLYLKILMKLITTKQEVSFLYKNFLNERVLHVGQPLEGLDKIKETILNGGILKHRLQQLSIFISMLSGCLNSNICQFMIKGCQSNDRQSKEAILGYLSTIFEGSNAADFKTHAERFISTQNVIIFIKEKMILQGKKIRSKAQIKSIVTLYPFSQYFPMHLPQVVLERMMAMSLQQNKDKCSLFLQDECLRNLLVLLYACLSYLDQHPDQETHVQHEIKRLLKNVLPFCGEKRNKQFLNLIDRIHKKMANPSTAIQNYIKRIFESVQKSEIGQISADNARANKKKQKLHEIKSKQKNLLQAFQIEEEDRSAQCIVCKNSKSGNPFLLAYFGYKNIFSKIVQAETPFLQFSSCGHYIHEECLQDSHKGDFKIWYPCILCKSICNILLPNVSNKQGEVEEGEEELFKRVLTFLKTLGGTYTFFYQDRKELMQFSIENVEGVFPLLFKTLVYQITFYPILNLQYFQRSQLPVTKFLFDLLQFTSDKLKGMIIVKKMDIKGNPFFVSLFNYISQQLSSVLKHQGHKILSNELPSDIVVMVEEIIYLLSKKEEKMEITPKTTKEYRDKVVEIFSKPPNDLRQLQSKPRECASCQKIVGNYELCLLCDWACCAKCSQVKKVHALEAHLSESVFVRNANGKYVYVHEELMGQFNSLYINYLGQEYASTEKAGQGDYLLSKEKWDNVVEDLLNNRLHREVMKFQ